MNLSSSSGNEVEIFGILVERVGQTVQWHVPGSVPGDSLLLWSENNLVSSQGGSFGSPSQESGLGNLPESALAKLVIIAWDDLNV